MKQLDTTIGGTVVIDASLYDEGKPIDQSSKWSGKNSPNDVFTYVSSVEELDTEFTNVKRDVTEVVIHASDTHTNKDIGSIEINNMQIEMEHDGIEDESAPDDEDYVEGQDDTSNASSEVKEKTKGKHCN